jgi:putative transposase
MDVCSRKIVGWAMREDLKSELVVDALGMAVWRRGQMRAAGAVHHSDSECVGCGWLRAA